MIEIFEADLNLSAHAQARGQLMDAYAIDDLGLLGQIAKSPALPEPYRNLPKREKTVPASQNYSDSRKKTKRKNPEIPEKELPTLWILASHISKPVLKDFHLIQHNDLDVARSPNPGIMGKFSI